MSRDPTQDPRKGDIVRFVGYRRAMLVTNRNHRKIKVRPVDDEAEMGLGQWRTRAEGAEIDEHVGDRHEAPREED